LPILTAEENVSLPLELDGIPAAEAKKRATEKLEMVGLASRKLHIPGKMSGGEQQRVAIARALAIEPTFLLADEPTGNLDTSNSKRVMSLLRKLVEDHQQTIVMVTHDPAVSAQADRIIHLLDGQVEREELLRERRSVTAQLAEARPR